MSSLCPRDYVLEHFLVVCTECFCFGNARVLAPMQHKADVNRIVVSLFESISVD